MYIPLLSNREPSNRERRIATIEFIVGFPCVMWLIVEMPDYPVAILGMAAILLLMAHGGAILARSNPIQTALWPTFARRMGTRRGEALLDERDQSLRHRAFVISYQILSLIIFAMLLGFDLLMLRMRGSAPHEGLPLQDLMLVLFAVLIPLVGVLPGLVLPWLERDSSDEDDNRRLFNPLSASRQGDAAELFPKWVRIVGSNWVTWGVVALLMFWVFHRFSPQRAIGAAGTVCPRTGTIHWPSDGHDNMGL